MITGIRMVIGDGPATGDQIKNCVEKSSHNQ